MADDASAFQLPGVTYWALPAGYGGLLPEYPPDLIVVHKTDNARSTARGEAQYAHTRPSSGATSSHFYVDGVEIIGSVPLNYKAWAAHSFGNSHGWHVESCGMTGTFMTAADQRAVGLVRYLCARGNIPVRHLSAAEIQAGARGIVGHHDLVVATGQGDHTDPGWSAAQWDEFIAAVGGPGGGDDMTPEEHQMLSELYAGRQVAPWQYKNDDGIAQFAKTNPGEWYPDMHAVVWDMYRKVQALEGKLAAGGLTAAEVAAELAKLIPAPPTAEQVADVLAARLKD